MNIAIIIYHYNISVITGSVGVFWSLPQWENDDNGEYFDDCDDSDDDYVDDDRDDDFGLL